MTSVPTNNFSLPGDHPFSPHQHELQDSEGPTLLHPSRLHDLQGFGFFCRGSRVVTHHVPQSAHTHHGKLPVHRHFTKRRPRRQNMQGTMQQRPIQVSSYDSLPRAAILPPFNSQLTIDPDGPHSLFSHHPSPASMFLSGTSGYQFNPDAISHVPPQITSFTAPQQTSLQPAFTFQLTPGTSEGIHALPMCPYPSASLADAPSSTVFDTGVQPSLSGAAAGSMAIPIPITPGLGPSSSSLPFTRTNATPPTSGPSADGAFMPIVCPWDYADAVPMSQPAHVEPEPGPTSVPHCPCCERRARPLVRVDNTIEWVRRDVMKLTLLLNFSSNAEAEAHESWEPRGV
ncbi:hypothetical protein BC827DRAFT_1271972 [Russula dissimulans]|nr:hypothetical protein BC827DRAFT_1271972 [Russula dissimulans]